MVQYLVKMLKKNKMTDRKIMGPEESVFGRKIEETEKPTEFLSRFNEDSYKIRAMGIDRLLHQGDYDTARELFENTSPEVRRYLSSGSMSKLYGATN